MGRYQRSRAHASVLMIGGQEPTAKADSEELQSDVDAELEAVE